MKPDPLLRRVMMAQVLEDRSAGTLMAAARVDDGTAWVHLLQRDKVGWRNITLDRPTTSFDMANDYDDLIFVGFPPCSHTPGGDVE